MPANITELFSRVVPPAQLVVGDAVGEDYWRDEALTVQATRPAALILPETTEQVAELLKVAAEHGIPVTPRGAGTGLSGGCVPLGNGLVLSTERMNRVLEVDTENHMAVVEPGVTLGQLEEAVAPHGLRYAIQPGESSATLGGNVATNAGGMRAVKYGVTRSQVLGLTVVLPGGEVIETGGKFVKCSTGYDLTQLIIGSEGTLCVVTRIILRLVPRLPHVASLLVAFPDVGAITRAVPKLVASGANPLFVEYIDRMAMMGVEMSSGSDLGIEPGVRDRSEAYLLLVVEGRRSDVLDADIEVLGEICAAEGAIETYMLPSSKSGTIIEARERSFWTGKRAGMADQVDVVVPRGSLSEYMGAVYALAAEHATVITGCGHAGDGNVHLGVFQSDAARLDVVLGELFDLGRRMGGQISAEHGIGRAKRKYYESREAPAKLALMRRIKAAFDPMGIMNPGVLFSS